MSNGQMTIEQALQVLRQVCENANATWKDHQTLQVALATISSALATASSDGAVTANRTLS
jgi:hypothetical protein